MNKPLYGVSGKEEVLVAINISNVPFFGAIKAIGDFTEITRSIGVVLIAGRL